MSTYLKPTLCAWICLINNPRWPMLPLIKLRREFLRIVTPAGVWKLSWVVVAQSTKSIRPIIKPGPACLTKMFARSLFVGCSFGLCFPVAETWFSFLTWGDNMNLETRVVKNWDKSFTKSETLSEGIPRFIKLFPARSDIALGVSDELFISWW